MSAARAPSRRILAVADWNRRDPSDAMNRTERWVMRQLLNQWAHPEFASIKGFQSNLESSIHNRGDRDVRLDRGNPAFPR